MELIDNQGFQDKFLKVVCMQEPGNQPATTTDGESPPGLTTD
jgi:hypothetical protein